MGERASERKAAYERLKWLSLKATKKPASPTTSRYTRGAASRLCYMVDSKIVYTGGSAGVDGGAAAVVDFQATTDARWLGPPTRNADADYLREPREAAGLVHLSWPHLVIIFHPAIGYPDGLGGVLTGYGGITITLVQPYHGDIPLWSSNRTERVGRIEKAGNVVASQERSLPPGKEAGKEAGQEPSHAECWRRCKHV
ncbi:hypothetical protein M433DRAFT_175072 [Acidomyces richmondensis BFW]|nr:hypothetical protein M433DRAFT_175072 [Acidomyces richmondensis BFW]